MTKSRGILPARQPWSAGDHPRDRIHKLLLQPDYRGTAAEIAAAVGCSNAAVQTYLTDLRAAQKAKVVGTTPTRRRHVLLWALDSDPLAAMSGTTVEKALASQPALATVWHPLAEPGDRSVA